MRQSARQHPAFGFAVTLVGGVLAALFYPLANPGFADDRFEWLCIAVSGAACALIATLLIALLMRLCGVSMRSALGWAAPLALMCLLALVAAFSAATTPGPVAADRAHHAPAHQLILIGLDGADWRIIDELRGQGLLPTIDRFVRSGVRGDLETLRPTLSPLIWTSIASGMRPAHHGVADFYTSAKKVRAKRLWEIASDYDLIAGVQSYLVTWPPTDEVDFVVPGWLSQDDRTVPPDLEFVKRVDRWLNAKEGAPSTTSLIPLIPSALRSGMTLRSIRELLGVVLLGARGVDPRELAVARRLASISFETDIFCHLLTVRRPDLGVFYHHHIDAVGHLFFKYYQPRNFESVSEEEAAIYGDALPRMYQASDRALERISRCAEQAATIMVVSDHGQRASFSESDPIPRIRSGPLLELLGLEDGLLATHTGRSVQLRAISDEVDLDEAFEKLRAVLILPQRAPLFHVRRRKDGFLLRASLPLDPSREIEIADRVVKMDDLISSSEGVSGQHTRTAMLLMVGPDIRAGATLPKAGVLDLAPTALGLLGLPIGRDMEGRFIGEILRDSASAELTLQFVDTHGAPSTFEAGADEPVLDESTVERLRGLGYLE